MTAPSFRQHDRFLEARSTESALGDDRFVARNFRLDEVVPDSRAHRYAQEVLPAADFREWQRKHSQFVEDHLTCSGSSAGPPAELNTSDPSRCPETFAADALPVTALPVDLGLSLVRIVGLYQVAAALGMDEPSVREALEDGVLRDGIVAGWVAKLPVKPVFATFWQDVKDLVPKTGEPPQGWEDDLRDRLGLSFYDPEEWSGPIQIMVLRYPISDLPPAGDSLTRPLSVPTELDGPFFPPFCPAPLGTGIGRVVDLGQTLSAPGPELLHPTVRWKGDHVAQLGAITRPVPPLDSARRHHLRLIQEVCQRPDYGLATDDDLL